MAAARGGPRQLGNPLKQGPPRQTSYRAGKACTRLLPQRWAWPKPVRTALPPSSMTTDSEVTLAWT